MKVKKLIPILLFTGYAACFFAQDTLVFQKGYSFPVKLVRESETKIQYLKHNVQRSPLYVIDKRYISEIRYQYPDSAGLLFVADTFVFEKDLDVWVAKLDGPGLTRGILAGLSDSSIVLRKKFSLAAGKKDIAGEMISLPYQQIRYLEVREQRRVRQYAIWGAAIGFVTGTIAGLAIFKDSAPCDNSVLNGQPCDQSLASPRSQVDKALLLGFGSAAGGFLTGGAYGSIRLKLPIHGRRDQFNMAVPRLERLANYLNSY